MNFFKKPLGISLIPLANPGRTIRVERRGESLRGLFQKEGMEMDMISPEDALHPAVRSLARGHGWFGNGVFLWNLKRDWYELHTSDVTLTYCCYYPISVTMIKFTVFKMMMHTDTFVVFIIIFTYLSLLIYCLFVRLFACLFGCLFISLSFHLLTYLLFP